MSDIVHADVFFFIASIGTVVMTIGAAITFYYVIGIVRDVRVVARKVRMASDELERDFEALRSAVKEKGTRMRSVFELFVGFLTRQIPGARSKRTTRTAAGKKEERRE